MMFKINSMCIRISKAVVLVSVIALTVSSCRITKPYVEPAAPAEELYRDVVTTDTNTIATLPWQEIFTDDPLQTLIETGIKNNFDLLSAYSRIQAAQAFYSQSKSALLPSLNLLGNVEHSNSTQFQLGFNSTWEIDIWGKLGSAKRAELANLLQTEAAAKAIQTGLVSTIATYYYQLLALDKQLVITEQTVENWKATVITISALKEAGRVTEAAVVQSEAQQYAAEVTIPDLKQSIKEFENALSVLIGSSPSTIHRGTLENQQITTDLRTGVPAQLLANRPDVQQAEFNLRQFFELTNVARASFYPSISITGSAGQYSSTLGNLFDPASSLARIGGGLLQPIFNNRMNKTRLEVAKAQQQEALYNFQSTLLTAGQEVSNAISLYNTSLAKTSVREKQIDALEKSVSYSQELLENGFAIYTEVITARQSLLQAELAEVNDRLQQFRSVIDLYRALGGGWR